jgi:succinate dehydrogenase / fumarate reductase cytochrome b subunit
MQKALTLVQTGIGKKALVAITGAILFGFVIAHMIGNLQVFLGREHQTAYGGST